MTYDEPSVFAVAETSRCDQAPVHLGCNRKVKVTERGNPDYAWYYLTNESDRNATVTIEKRWKYNGECRTATEQVVLYPMQDREVFSFPRRQDPTCSILSCALS